jgi:chromate transporter
MEKVKQGSFREVLSAFLKLGSSSFGGPTAHLALFRQEFVSRRRWIPEAEFAELAGLCQFLPGPSSSQVAFAIGLLRAGYPGGLAAWIGFTLPSALVLILFASGVSIFSGPAGKGILHGLKVAAVAIVANAVREMFTALCPDAKRAFIALISLLIILSTSSPALQIVALLLGGVAGYWICREPLRRGRDALSVPVSREAAVAALATFLLFLAGAPFFREMTGSEAAAQFNAFFRSGALVFGGGHVVLPFLREAFVTPGWLSNDAFLAGYGAAQAVPGPLFTFAAYLGAVIRPSGYGLPGAALGLAGIFLPGILLLIGMLPFWKACQMNTGVQAAMHGVKAAVVGLLGAALYRPIGISALLTRWDFAIALTLLFLLIRWRVSPLVIVLAGAAGGVLIEVFAS